MPTWTSNLFSIGGLTQQLASQTFNATLDRAMRERQNRMDIIERQNARVSQVKQQKKAQAKAKRQGALTMGIAGGAALAGGALLGAALAPEAAAAAAAGPSAAEAAGAGSAAYEAALIPDAAVIAGSEAAPALGTAIEAPTLSATAANVGAAAEGVGAAAGFTEAGNSAIRSMQGTPESSVAANVGTKQMWPSAAPTEIIPSLEKVPPTPRIANMTPGKSALLFGTLGVMSALSGQDYLTPGVAMVERNQTMGNQNYWRNRAAVNEERGTQSLIDYRNAEIGNARARIGAMASPKDTPQMRNARFVTPLEEEQRQLVRGTMVGAPPTPRPTSAQSNARELAGGDQGKYLDYLGQMTLPQERAPSANTPLTDKEAEDLFSVTDARVRSLTGDNRNAFIDDFVNRHGRRLDPYLLQQMLGDWGWIPPNRRNWAEEFARQMGLSVEASSGNP